MMKMRLACVLALTGSWSLGQERAAAKETLQVAKEAVQQSEEARGMVEELMRMNQTLVGENKKLNESALEFAKGFRRLQIDRFINLVDGLEAESSAYIEGLELIGEGRFKDPKVVDFQIGATTCFVKEVGFRHLWKNLVKRPMTKAQRDEVGKSWVKMAKVNDSLFDMLWKNRASLPELSVKAMEDRQKAKAGPKAPEPEIIAE